MKRTVWLASASLAILAYALWPPHRAELPTALRLKLTRVVPSAWSASPAPSEPPGAAQTRVTPIRAYTANDVLNLSLRPDTRVEAVYQLSQAGPRAQADLERIVTTPLPAEAARRGLEVSLRITALGALDQLAIQGVDVRDAFAKSLATNSDSSLQTITLVGLQGLEEGRPGKIKRFVDSMVNR